MSTDYEGDSYQNEIMTRNIAAKEESVFRTQVYRRATRAKQSQFAILFARFLRFACSPAVLNTRQIENNHAAIT